MKLTGKKTLITGAASGIGEAIALNFAKAGAEVWAADRNAEALARLAARAAENGLKLRTVRLDVADVSACRDMAQEFHRHESHGLDVLVNNAGIGAVGTVLETEVTDLDRLYEVNVRAPYLLTQLFLPPMLARGSGSIINIASIGGVVGLSNRAAYCTTKFAVVGMTKAMALDHAARQVRINCICPARVETPFVSARLKEYADPAKAYAEMSESQPIGRMGTPGEIAAAAAYLAGDDAAFITGSAFVIDGGLSAGR